jgi:hypothetical protein
MRGGSIMTTRLTFTAGNHSYWLADPDTGKKQRLTSVTTLIKQLDAPALKRWAANTAADYAVDHWDDLAQLSWSERRSAIAGAPWQARDKAAAKGTAIHAMAEDLLHGRPVDCPDDRPRHPRPDPRRRGPVRPAGGRCPMTVQEER